MSYPILTQTKCMYIYDFCFFTSYNFFNQWSDKIHPNTSAIYLPTAEVQVFSRCLWVMIQNPKTTWLMLEQELMFVCLFFGLFLILGNAKATLLSSPILKGIIWPRTRTRSKTWISPKTWFLHMYNNLNKITMGIGQS